MKKYLIKLTLTVLIIFAFSCKSDNSKVNKNDITIEGSDSKASTETQHVSMDVIVQNLLDMSAKDFHDHKPPVPKGFRNVRFKYLTKPSKEKTYLICGQFLDQENSNKEKWIDFATIQTDPYEQWTGSNGSTYCQESKEINYTKIDLSIALKNRFDSLQNIEH